MLEEKQPQPTPAYSLNQMFKLPSREPRENKENKLKSKEQNNKDEKSMRLNIENTDSQWEKELILWKDGAVCRFPAKLIWGEKQRPTWLIPGTWWRTAVLAALWEAEAEGSHIQAPCPCLGPCLLAKLHLPVCLSLICSLLTLWHLSLVQAPCLLVPVVLQ